MSKFEIWLENSDLGYYAKESEDGKYMEYLINKWNGVVVRIYWGTRSAYVKNSDGSWTRYGIKKLIEELDS